MIDWDLYIEQIARLGVNADSVLNPPSNNVDLENCENLLGFKLPQQLKELYLKNDGQLYDKWPIFPDSYAFLSLDNLREVWVMWKEVLESDNHILWQKTWIPFAQNIAGDLLCCVVQNDKKYEEGSILKIGHESAMEKFIARSIMALLSKFVRDIDDSVLVLDDLNECISSNGVY